MLRPVVGLELPGGECSDAHRRSQEKIPVLEEMVDLRAIGVFHEPHLLIVGERDVQTCLDACDKAWVHLVAKVGDAIRMTTKMSRPEEARQFRAFRPPRRFDLFAAPAETGFEDVRSLAHQLRHLGINACMAKIWTESDTRRARPARTQDVSDSRPAALRGSNDRRDVGRPSP